MRARAKRQQRLQLDDERPRSKRRRCGYLEGNYVGADFLLSAAALIAAFGAGLSAQLLFAAREHDRGPKEAARLLLGWASGT